MPMPRVGSRAPAFSLPSTTGRRLALRDFEGRPVVLYFYPKDASPGCTAEACEFRDNWDAVRATRAAVLGVSPDPVASHRLFRTAHQLPFPLLADVDHAVAKAYGAWGEKSMYGKKYVGILRSTFVIDRAGRVAHVFPKVRPKGHAAAVLAVLRELVM